MEFENEKKNEEQAAEQQHTESHEGGYQANYRPGRSPRPRIHQQTRPYTPGGFNRRSNEDEGGFRPEGFGGGLQSQSRPQGEYGQPRGGYRPRNNYNQEGGYQPRQQGGYRPRPQYGQPQAEEFGQQPRSGYQPRQQQGGYRPRPQYGQPQAEEFGQQPRSGYQPRQQQGGYRPRPQYGQPQEGGYQPRGYQPRGGYQQGGYQQGGYQGLPQGGFGSKKKKQKPYDPNAKYSMKKRIEYKEENFDPNEPLRLNKFLANAGVCSRREADEFIQAGVVKVNGEVVTELGTKVLRSDEVMFHDRHHGEEGLCTAEQTQGLCHYKRRSSAA